MAQFVYFAYSYTPEPRMLTRFLIFSCVTKWNFILVYKDNIREMSAFRRLSLNPLQRDRCRGTANPLAGEKKHPVCRSTEPSWSGTGGGGPPSYILTRDESQDQLSLLLRTGSHLLCAGHYFAASSGVSTTCHFRKPQEESTFVLAGY